MRRGLVDASLARTPEDLAACAWGNAAFAQDDDEGVTEWTVARAMQAASAP